MRLFARFSSLALVLVVIAFPLAAGNAGSSANGTFQFTHDGFSKSIEFNVRQHNSNGDASGEMTFIGGAEIPDQDVDGEGSSGPSGTIANLTLKAKFDCLRLNGNRASMTGVVTESSVSAYVGKRVLLAVEDNGEPNNVDRYTWGVYRSTELGWTPEDAEVPGDTGWGSTWPVSDFERIDDVVQQNSRSTLVSCKSFGLGSYDLRDLEKGAGNIQVKP